MRIVFATASILKGYNTPAPTTIKRWVQKVGYYKLTLPKETADDWMVIIDASIQIGRKKCVLVIGCREADFPMNRALALKDLQILSLRIVSNVNADVITKILEEVALTVGRITAICSDRGSDMFRGIKNFQIKHPEARHVCDTAHRIANLLEETLENSKIWKQFRDLVTHSRRRMQNSSVAGYLPPSPRTKARYMNMDSLIKWAVDMLLIIDNPELFQSEVEELKKYVGWLINFREDIAYWNGIISIGLVARDLIRKEGMHINIVNSFEEAISNIKMGFRELQFADVLAIFLLDQSRNIKPGERLVGSTEALESLFGKLKYMEYEQTAFGFTSLVLAVVAHVGTTDDALIKEAITKVKLSNIDRWSEKEIGVSIQSQRLYAKKKIVKLKKKVGQESSGASLEKVMGF